MRHALRLAGGLAVSTTALACFVELVDLRTPLADAGPLDDAGRVVDAGRDHLDGGVDPEEQVTELVADPFSGGSFAFVTTLGSDVIVGPSPDGSAVGVIDDDGISLLPLRFLVDDTGNRHRNPNATSIGFTGCALAACGPDGENGRGLLATVEIGGETGLLLAGSRTDEFDYAYFGAIRDGALELRYIDMSALLGGASHGLSAAHSFRGRLYLGVPDSGGARPDLAMIAIAPAEPGLDIANQQACEAPTSTGCDLEGGALPALGLAGTLSMVDAISSFNGRLYLGNSGGIARAEVELPGDASSRPQDWLDVTPSDVAWAAHVSTTTTKRADLEPNDRAVVGFASASGRLVLARNTVDGPQLWSCAPASAVVEVGSASDCEAPDWRLLDEGDGLTRFTDDVTHASIVIEHAGSIFVGFDATAGASLYRSVDGVSFTGADGCDARDPSCIGLGGRGLGAAGQTRFLSAAGNAGAIYVVTGDGVTPPRVVRVRL